MICMGSDKTFDSIYHKKLALDSNAYRNILQDRGAHKEYTLSFHEDKMGHGVKVEMPAQKAPYIYENETSIHFQDTMKTDDGSVECPSDDATISVVRGERWACYNESNKELIDPLRKVFNDLAFSEDDESSVFTSNTVFTEETSDLALTGCSVTHMMLNESTSKENSIDAGLLSIGSSLSEGIMNKSFSTFSDPGKDDNYDFSLSHFEKIYHERNTTSYLSRFRKSNKETDCYLYNDNFVAPVEGDAVTDQSERHSLRSTPDESRKTGSSSVSVPSPALKSKEKNTDLLNKTRSPPNRRVSFSPQRTIAEESTHRIAPDQDIKINVKDDEAPKHGKNKETAKGRTKTPETGVVKRKQFFTLFSRRFGIEIGEKDASTLSGKKNKVLPVDSSAIIEVNQQVPVHEKRETSEVSSIDSSLNSSDEQQSNPDKVSLVIATTKKTENWNEPVEEFDSIELQYTSVEIGISHYLQSKKGCLILLKRNEDAQDESRDDCASIEGRASF